MAFFLQLRNLKKEVQQQLQDLEKEEKGVQDSITGSNGDEHSSTNDGGESGESSSDHGRQGNKSTDPYTRIPGIELQTREDGSQYYLVSWSSPSDPKNPQNWSYRRRSKMTVLLFLIAFISTMASSIDSAVAERAAEDFGVSSVTEALGGTAIFLIGFGTGALLSSPMSELVGRFPTYLGSLVLFGIWLMASALSPNIGAQIAFRFLAGLCSSAPLTVAGGSISDIWNPREKTLAFPIFGVAGFGGPILGPVVAAYIGFTTKISWRWAEWIMLILDGLTIVLVAIFMEETLAPRLLTYRAYFFRKHTQNENFKTSIESKGETTGEILWRNATRPFILALEPILIFFTLYLTVVYIILFTFLDGYPYIFQMVYGINTGLTFTIFVALFIGVLLNLVTVPWVYHRTLKQLSRDGDEGQGLKIDRESRLLFAMVGAPFIPIGLFWMGWTNFPHISIWSPIMASVAVGFGINSIFLSSYMYIIDSYEVMAASALCFVTLVRYLAAGGMTVVGVPFYGNLGSHYTLTILACISAAAVPIPYAFYRYGHIIREKSQYAVSPGT